jgi:hypothetical protein
MVRIGHDEIEIPLAGARIDDGNAALCRAFHGLSPPSRYR